MNHVDANLGFDIGANIGQFAQDLRSAGHAGNIVGFDPLVGAHARLESAARRDFAWFIHPQVAVGDHSGEIDINVAGNSVSSSILPVMEAHSSVAVESAYIAVERTSLVRLDTVSSQYIAPSTRLFIKIDT